MSLFLSVGWSNERIACKCCRFATKCGFSIGECNQFKVSRWQFCINCFIWQKITLRIWESFFCVAISPSYISDDMRACVLKNDVNTTMLHGNNHKWRSATSFPMIFNISMIINSVLDDNAIWLILVHFFFRCLYFGANDCESSRISTWPNWPIEDTRCGSIHTFMIVCDE